MLRVLITVVLALGSLASSEQAKVKPAASRNSDHAIASDYQPSLNYDPQAEQRLLDLANHARARVGAPPLQFDESVLSAAPGHAAEMAKQQQLSHQLPGERSLPRRLAHTRALHLAAAGENVAPH